MPNVIELVTKYLPILDEQYKLASKSAILDYPAEWIRETENAKKIKIAKISTDGLADYSRNSGFVAGDIDLTWEEHEFTKDRGRRLQVDALDNIETMQLAFGRLAGTFNDQAVIPELDAYRFNTYYKAASAKTGAAYNGTVVQIANGVAGLTNANILSTIDDIDAAMDDALVPEEDRILFVDPARYKLIVNDTTISKSLDVNDTMSKALNKKIYDYNGHPIIKVPANRFYTALTFKNGTTSGQEAGGYTGTGNIGLLMVSKASVVQVVKRAIARFWAPTKAEMDANGADGVNPNADAWAFDYRNYHDAWVLDNKIKGIGVVVATA